MIKNETQTEIRYVTVIIPCRNEERFIGQCLRTVFDNDYPEEYLEILVVDGMSEDKTREIVKTFMHIHPNLKLIDNPLKITPAALNTGVKNASGEIIIRVDAHAKYPENYFSTLVHQLKHLDADNVGGAWNIHPGDDTIIARAIAVATASRFGIGDAAYKNPGRKIKEVDTVPYGCYPRGVFDRIGFFDEELVRNQDDEFNARLKKNGGKIFLIPDLIIDYYARPDLKSIARMFFGYGMYKPLVNLKTGYLISLRQTVPFLFVLYLLSLVPLIWLSSLLMPWYLFPLFIYVICLILISLIHAVRKRDPILFIYLPLVFFTIHLSYGAGYLTGLVRIPGRRR